MAPGSVHVGPVLGTLLMGGMFALALWGTICVQTFTYFMGRSRDWVAVSAMIAGLWLLDTFGSALIIYTLFFYMVINFMNPSAIQTLVWSDAAYVFATSLSTFVIRALFIWKVYQLSSKNVWLSGTLLALSSLALATGIVAFVKFIDVESFHILGNIFIWGFLYIGSETASDVSISVVLSVVLYRSRAGLQRTDGVMRTHMIYTINIGLLAAAVVAILVTVFYASMPKNLTHQALYFCLPKIYLCTYLAMLNARQELREETANSVTIQMSRLRFPEQDSATSATANDTAGKASGDPDSLAHTLVDRKVEDGG